MPNPKNRIKLTGDTHLPDVGDDEFEREEAHPESAAAEGGGERSDREAPAGKGERKTRSSSERR